jgi:hypothetical protein
MLSRLLAQKLLTPTEYKQLVQGSLTERDQSLLLLASFLPSKEGSFAKFCQILEQVEGQEHIAAEILSHDTTPTHKTPTPLQTWFSG